MSTPARRAGPAALYLNVDLEIRSRTSLLPVVEALRPHLLVLHAGRVRGTFLASFQLPGVTRSPDVAIRRFAQALADLAPALQARCREARDRVFDIGLEWAVGSRAFPLALRGDTVKTIAQLNARVAVTLYPRPRHEPRKPPAKRGRRAPGR